VANGWRGALCALAACHGGSVAAPWYEVPSRAQRRRDQVAGPADLVSASLVGELVGIAALETGDQVVHFCQRDIG